MSVTTLSWAEQARAARMAELAAPARPPRPAAQTVAAALGNVARTFTFPAPDLRIERLTNGVVLAYLGGTNGCTDDAKDSREVIQYLTQTASPSELARVPNHERIGTVVLEMSVFFK